MVGARSAQKQEDTGRTVPNRNLADPKLTPKKSTGNHSRGRQKQELLFLIRFAVFLFFGSSSDPKNKKILDPTKNPGFLNSRWGVIHGKSGNFWRILGDERARNCRELSFTRPLVSPQVADAGVGIESLG